MVLNKGKIKEGEKRNTVAAAMGRQLQDSAELGLSIEIMRSDFRTSLKFEFY